MKTTIRHLLTAAALLVAAGGLPGNAAADGPEDYGYDAPDPNAGYYPQDPNQVPGQAGGDPVYQPPPEGICFDDNNQSYDCSRDEDYSQYNQLDDGYDPSAYQDFRDALNPYGQWVDNPQYGQVWVPSTTVVGSDFTPYYSGGHWVLSDYGWTWVSDYNWGWGPFHYGRWLQLGGYGWSWIPGRVWGPAWVHWRAGGGYVGWAPLPPRGIRIAPPIYGGRHSWNFVIAGQLNASRLVRVAPPLLPGVFHRTVIANDYRSIGSTRIIVGPPAHHLPALHVSTVPLGSLGPAMPRGQVVVRPGVPLQQRPYYAPYNRPGTIYRGPGQPSSFPRPGYPAPAPGYPRPGYPAPAPSYPRPGYPAPAPGYPHPGPAPNYPHTGPAPNYPHPAPSYPGPAPVPNYPRPAPSYPGPAPVPNYPRPAPSYPGPAPVPNYPRPAPSYPSPAPVPNYPRPAPSYPSPGPVYHPTPAPTYHPAPAPTYHPAPAPTYHPAPAPHPSPAPAYHPAPAPAPHPAPSHGHR